jgi:CxxC motif-containing protein
MVKEYTCIICPNGCGLTAELEDGKLLAVHGAICQRGREYVLRELTHPQRNIASSILVEGGELPLASVRLSKAIPKDNIHEVMAVIKAARLSAPVTIGQVAIANVLGLGSDIIVTRNVAVKKTER